MSKQVTNLSFKEEIPMKHLKMKFAVVLAALLVSGCDPADTDGDGLVYVVPPIGHSSDDACVEVAEHATRRFSKWNYLANYWGGICYLDGWKEKSPTPLGEN